MLSGQILNQYQMLQDKIFSYFQRNPKLKVLFFLDDAGMLSGKLGFHKSHSFYSNCQQVRTS